MAVDTWDSLLALYFIAYYGQHQTFKLQFQNKTAKFLLLRLVTKVEVSNNKHIAIVFIYLLLPSIALLSFSQTWSRMFHDVSKTHGRYVCLCIVTVGCVMPLM